MQISEILARDFIDEVTAIWNHYLVDAIKLVAQSVLGQLYQLIHW